MNNQQGQGLAPLLVIIVQHSKIQQNERNETDKQDLLFKAEKILKDARKMERINSEFN